jgi:D-alanyl-D-alanine carboxypeptidase
MKTSFKKLPMLLFGLLLLWACEKQPVIETPSSACALTQKTHPKAAQYQQIIDKFMQAGAVGVSVTVRSPEGVWSSTGGKADLPAGIDLTPCHTLRIGSISKTFAAAAILKLQDQGRLNINDQAAKYLPTEYVREIANLDKVTIRNLLQHTSGVYEYLGIDGILKVMNLSVKSRSARENLKVAFGKKSQFELGKEWIYTNSNYLLIALILENVTQKSAYEAVSELIIKPLGLQNTYASTQLPKSLSRGYYDSMNNGLMRDQTNIDHYAVGGQDMLDGGMISNTYDLALFMEALKTGKIISAKSLADMEVPIGLKVDIPEEFSFIKDYGLGLFMLNIGGKKGFGHGGNVFCFNGAAYYFPEQKVSVAILLNSYSKKQSEVLYDEDTFKLALAE